MALAGIADCFQRLFASLYEESKEDEKNEIKKNEIGVKLETETKGVAATSVDTNDRQTGV